MIISLASLQLTLLDIPPHLIVGRIDTRLPTAYPLREWSVDLSEICYQAQQKLVQNHLKKWNNSIYILAKRYIIPTNYNDISNKPVDQNINAPVSSQPLSPAYSCIDYLNIPPDQSGSFDAISSNPAGPTSVSSQVPFVTSNFSTCNEYISYDSKSTYLNLDSNSLIQFYEELNLLHQAELFHLCRSLALFQFECLLRLHSKLKSLAESTDIMDPEGKNKNTKTSVSAPMNSIFSNSVHVPALKYSDNVILVLEESFSRSKYVSKEERCRISHLTNLSDKQIMVWFTNRRTKFSKKGTVAAY